MDAYLKMKRLIRRFDDEKRVPAKQDGPATFVLRIIEPAYEPTMVQRAIFQANERQLALTSQPTPGRQHFLFPIVTVLVLPYQLEAIWIPLCQRTKGVGVFSSLAFPLLGRPVTLIVLAHSDAIPAVLAIAPAATLVAAPVKKKPSAAIC
jgi:hypothetical protein